MKVLSWALGLFCASLLLHLIVWRAHLPKRQIKRLIELFLISLLLGLTGLFVFSIVYPWECLHIALLFLCLSLAYLCTYSAIAAQSPSLVIVLKIARAGSNGLDREELFTGMDDDLLIRPRIKDLADAQMINLLQGKYRLSTKGRLFGRIFTSYRKLLCLPKGG